MLRSIFRRLNSGIGGGALLIAFFSIASKLIGLVRDRLISGLFGASRMTDIYFASFKIPDFIFNIFVLGSLTSAFIPVFQRSWNSNREEGLRLSGAILNILLLVVVIVSAALYIAAPYLVPLTVPGFDDPAVALTIRMTRLLLLCLVFFTASNVLSGVLNAWHKFFTFSLSSVLYNIGIIFGIVFLYPVLGFDGLGVGVILGSLLHFGVQLVEAIRRGWGYRLTLRVTDDVRRIFRLMIPRSFGLAGNQIALVIITVLASLLPAGHLAVFNYANNLQAFPVSIFGISLAVAAFPSFSLAASQQDMNRFKKLFSQQAIRILYFLIPVAVFILILRVHIIRIVLGSSSFGWDVSVLTANALGLFALSLPAQGLIPLLSRSFYALEDTKTPVLVNLAGMLSIIALSIVTMPIFGVLGLALSDSIGSIITMCVLYILLKRRTSDLDGARLVKALNRISWTALIAGVFCYMTLSLAGSVSDVHTFSGALTQGAFAAISGGVVYFLMSFILDIDEVKQFHFALRALFRNND